jgi:hypothetical protein
MKNDGKKKNMVFADASHGTYDMRLEYGRPLAKPDASFDTDDRKTLAAVRGEMAAKTTTSVAYTAAKPMSADSLDTLQQKMTVTLKRKRKLPPNSESNTESKSDIKAKSNIKAKKNGDVKSLVSDTASKSEPATKVKSGSDLSALQGLVGNYRSSSDSDSDASDL